MEIKTVGVPVYENNIFGSTCGIVFKGAVSGKILEVQNKYLKKAKNILFAAKEEDIMLDPGKWYYSKLFGAHAGFYANDEIHAKLNELKRPFRKEVKDIIMRNPDSCYTYDWTMSEYERGIDPEYLHYTNPYDEEGHGAWAPRIEQRLKYVEPSANIYDAGKMYLCFEDHSIKDKILRMQIQLTKYEEFCICSSDDAKKIVTERYEKKRAEAEKSVDCIA